VDDGIRLGLANFFGQAKSSGITLDFIQQRTVGSRGDYALLSYSDLNWTAGVEDIYIGNATTSLGQLFGTLNFSNTDNFTGLTSATNLNNIKLYPGGAQGNAGFTADINWNLESGNIRYGDDGSYIWLTGLASKGSGIATLDMVQGNENGLKLGFEDFSGSYRFKGLYTSETLPSEATLKIKRQGGIELLYALGIYQAMDFGGMEGSIIFTGGGTVGTGISFESDVVFTNTNAGLLVDYDSPGCSDGCGLWATNMTLESHIRNGSIDVQNKGGFKSLDANGNFNETTKEAIVLRTTAHGHSEMGAVKIGKTGSAGSLGLVSTSDYKTTMISIATGGDPARGNQGISINMKEKYLAADGSTYTDANGVVRNKTNTIRWTPNSGKVNNYLELGGMTTDNYGFKNNLNIDVVTVNNVTGFSVNALTELKQVNLGYINVGANPIVQDAYLYNVRLNSNIVATPLN
ncbi:MAG: hypothetical protein HRU08_06655, partial [Oleispira sp.]|nr:hypothetical protein [Oleispira sp.]